MSVNNFKGQGSVVLSAPWQLAPSDLSSPGKCFGVSHPNNHNLQ